MENTVPGAAGKMEGINMQRNQERAIFANMTVVYDTQGRVLVLDRKDPGWHGLAFPGGHVEDGESFTDAAIREIYEETGLVLKNVQLCGIKDWVREDGARYVVMLYKTCDFSGSVKSSEEGEVFWIPLSELKAREKAEGMDALIRLYAEDTLSEEYFYMENGQWVEVLK